MMWAGEQEVDLKDTHVRSTKFGVRLRVCVMGGG